MYAVKILAIAPDRLPLPPVKGGSVEAVMHNVFTRMAGTDQVTLVSCTHPKLPGTNAAANGKLKYVRFPYPSGRQYIQTAMRKLRGQRFDVIQIDNRPAFIRAIRKAFPKTPIVLSLHSLYFLSQMSRKKGHAVLRQTDGVACVVSSLAATFKARYPKYAAKFKPILLGVDTDKFRPRSRSYKNGIRQKYGLKNTFNLLFVGRIIPRKGLHTLVQAAALLRKENKKVTIVAVGASWPGRKSETPYMRKVRQMAKRLNVPIRFTGYITPNKIHEMYHLADIFVCPTQFKEGFACVNSEAMASGIPLVASARGGILEIVQTGKSGLLVNDYKSPAAFASAMSRIMKNPALGRRLSAGGRSRAVASFSWTSTVNRLRAYYRSLM
ncbi:glycosyltransferase family 4 protein [Paenibacillus sp. N4]|uniref:glycosyltransferase family 4 protein n=1 Tax=Paenibacillus vietnamensis TaxID=2590547 RepID=UPI001CD04FF1|nr:glycosyltransferase family 4 protein [Paenibacillus vietnamensis]MCA0754344.1 glycosyltransferase family 4 protein [Paenibacillus vietnamensis]